MLINDREYNKFIENISIYKLILIHGQDRGKVNEKSLEIVKRLNYLNQNSVETIVRGIRPSCSARIQNIYILNVRT